jgi:hypothetical protein
MFERGSASGRDGGEREKFRILDLEFRIGAEEGGGAGAAFTNLVEENTFRGDSGTP